MKKETSQQNNGLSFTERLRERFLRWFYSEKKEKSPLPRRGAAVAVLVCGLLFALYYLGVFDLSFIARPDDWDDHSEKLYSIWDDKKNDADTTKTDETEEIPGKEDNGPEVVSSVNITVRGRANTTPGADEATVFPTREDLAEEGYYLTDAVFEPEVSRIGAIKFDYSLPMKFSYRDMNTRCWDITKYDDGTASKVEDTVKAVERPAVYLYMGYIIYDDRGKELYIIDRNGAVITNYDDNYLPAFARDSAGNPLFYTSYGYYADVPATDEVNEAGEHTYTYRGGYIAGKNYYTLSYGGYFVGSDYVEERDGRGLNFDFPAYYGLSDTYKYRVGIMTAKYSAFLDGSTALVNFMNWNYFTPYDPEIPDLEKIIAKEKEYDALSKEDKLKAIKEKKTPEDEFKLKELLPYYTAFNYNEGYATVVTDQVDEEPKYETKELRVINTAGNIMFASRKKYQNTTFKAYCSDRFLLPLSKGEDSIGSIYFDHGLMRLRKVSFDQFQLDEFHVFRVNMDADVLVYPNGTEFPIPEGYTLKSYSDGVLTLERGGMYGYLRTDGTWIAEPLYTSAAPFHAGVGVLTKQDGTMGAVDTNGTVLIPFRYSYVSNRSDDLIAAWSESGGWELFGIFTNQ